ncbi:uncharacterized protein LOC107227804 [Neodiprion lecontei]|uniref:Uncharacterized protein LOC107227804 n=1 Tax=Neodiprion lecontei TaxID=441921 RepID=A0A6J0CCV0_NEOLC|nr:uncharacterized protein LOC107227804 [Neodiprion lecontei]
MADENKILQVIQRNQSSKDIDRIMNKETLKNYKLASLNPFVDEHVFLRVGGRLKRAEIPYEQKHPILLPTHHPVTDMIIKETNERAYHASIQSTLCTVRQRGLLLLDGKNQVRNIIRKCVQCLRHRPVPLESQMADLPQARVNGTAAFLRVDVNYFGPVLVKEKKFRNQKFVKSYGCVFVCIATKAVHLEIVSNLSTDAFLAASRRFIGRRGVPTHVFSDNGTNFVGAHKQLRELYALLETEELQQTVATYATQRNII